MSTQYPGTTSCSRCFSCTPTVLRQSAFINRKMTLTRCRCAVPRCRGGIPTFVMHARVVCRPGREHIIGIWPILCVCVYGMEELQRTRHDRCSRISDSRNRHEKQECLTESIFSFCTYMCSFHPQTNHHHHHPQLLICMFGTPPPYPPSLICPLILAMFSTSSIPLAIVERCF